VAIVLGVVLVPMGLAPLAFAFATRRRATKPGI
jgi:hypothetical protein